VNNCPHCRAELVPGDSFCSQCGAALVLEAPPALEPDPDLRLPATLQGVAPDWSCNGDFDGAEYPGLSFPEAIGVLRALQAPPADADPGEFCWPNLVFEDGTSICRCAPGEEGDYMFFPDEGFGNLAQAESVIRNLYLGEGR